MIAMCASQEELDVIDSTAKEEVLQGKKQLGASLLPVADQKKLLLFLKVAHYLAQTKIYYTTCLSNKELKIL
jgi:hypothetical protein